MLVVMQQGATEEQIEGVIARLVELSFDVHRSTGVIHTVLGGVGGKYDFDLAVFQVMEGVKEAHRIVSPYKLASRSFRPAGTVVRVGSLDIGNGSIQPEPDQPISRECSAAIGASSIADAARDPPLCRGLRARRRESLGAGAGLI